MIDLKLDDNADLAVDTGELELVDGIDEIAQGVAIALRSVKGEYVLDRREGLDLFGRVLGRQDEEIRDAEIKREILARPGVDELVEYTATVDDATRELAVSFVARAELGATLAVDGQRIFVPAPPELPAEPDQGNPVELALAPRPVFNASGVIGNTFPYSEESAVPGVARSEAGVFVATPRAVYATEDT